MSQNKAGGFMDSIEETLIGAILGLMTLITFANVVTRYGFNSNILWALEVTSILFAWLVLLGTSYCVKINAHLGVDAVLNLVSDGMRKTMTILAAAVCILYSVFLLKGGWDFWSNFANLPNTTGRWFPTGFEQDFLAKGWYETEDVVMPQSLQFMSEIFNEGEKYEKMPRLVPYFMLPFGFALLLYRFIQSTLMIWRGDRDLLIVSHEAEDAVSDAAAKLAKGE